MTVQRSNHRLTIDLAMKAYDRRMGNIEGTLGDIIRSQGIRLMVPSDAAEEFGLFSWPWFV